MSALPHHSSVAYLVVPFFHYIVPLCAVVGSLGMSLTSPVAVVGSLGMSLTSPVVCRCFPLFSVFGGLGGGDCSCLLISHSVPVSLEFFSSLSVSSLLLLLGARA